MPIKSFLSERYTLTFSGALGIIYNMFIVLVVSLIGVLYTSKGVPIAVALSASGIPFKGRFDKKNIFFSYDGHYKDSVHEIIDKFTSDIYANQRNESCRQL